MVLKQKLWDFYFKLSIESFLSFLPRPYSPESLESHRAVSCSHGITEASIYQHPRNPGCELRAGPGRKHSDFMVGLGLFSFRFLRDVPRGALSEFFAELRTGRKVKGDET